MNERILRSQPVILKPTAPQRDIQDCLQSLSANKCVYYSNIYFTYNFTIKVKVKVKVEVKVKVKVNARVKVQLKVYFTL